MIDPEQTSSLKEYLQTAQSIMIVLGPKPTNDQLAMASALYLGISNLEKEVSIYAPKNFPPQSFSGFKNLSTKLGKQNLVIGFDYDEGAVDKVSYHISEEINKFYLTIKPKKGQKPLDKSKVDFSYAGADADLVFLIGIHDLEALDQLYFGYESLYENAFVVTLHSFKTEVGNIQFDLSGTSSMSESLVDLLEKLEIQLTADAATDLLLGIEGATKNLQSRIVSANTFEVVAKLLRSGARRVAKIINESQSINPKTSKKPRKNIVVKRQKSG